MDKLKKIIKYPYIYVLAFSLFLLAFTNKPSGLPYTYRSAEDTVYVIQLRKNTNPKVIQSAKNGLIKKYPDKILLTQVQPPNHILSIGYFATEAEAQEFKKNLEKDFPGCTVLPFEKKK